MQLNTICFIVWENIAATLLLNMPCVNNKSAYHSACSVLSVFSSWEGSRDSLYYPHFLSFKMCFNYFPPTLPHYYLKTSSLPEFCGVYVRLRTNSIQRILNFYEVPFRSTSFYCCSLWVSLLGRINFFLLYWWSLGGHFQRSMWEYVTNNHKALYNKIL